MNEITVILLTLSEMTLILMTLRSTRRTWIMLTLQHSSISPSRMQPLRVIEHHRTCVVVVLVGEGGRVALKEFLNY